MGLQYLKVGRLYSGENGLIHIIRDRTGEVGTMKIENVKKIISGEDAQPISPEGYSLLSLTEKGDNMVISGTDG